MQFPKFTRGRIIALGIVAVTVVALAALGGPEFWNLVASVLGG